MRGQQKYYQVLPEKVIDDLPVISELLAPSIKGFHVDCLKEIVSIVAKNVQKNNGSAPLQYKIIRELVPQGHLYLKGLLDTGIVIREGQFICKIQCYRYRFSPAYISRYKTVALNNLKLINRIRAVWDKHNKKAAKSIRGRSEQRQ